MGRVLAIAKLRGAERDLFIRFLNNVCANCENYKSGCSEFSADLENCKECFEQYKNDLRGGGAIG